MQSSIEATGALIDNAVSHHGDGATEIMTPFMGPSGQDVEWKAGESDLIFADTYRLLECLWRNCLMKIGAGIWLLRSCLGSRFAGD